MFGPVCDKPALTDQKFCNVTCWMRWATAQPNDMMRYDLQAKEWIDHARAAGTLAHDAIPCLVPRSKSKRVKKAPALEPAPVAPPAPEAKRKRPAPPPTDAPAAKKPLPSLPARAVKTVATDIVNQAPFNTKTSARWNVTFQRPGEQPKHFESVPNLREAIATVFATDHVIPCEIVGPHTLKLYPTLAADPLFIKANSDQYVLATIGNAVTLDHGA